MFPAGVSWDVHATAPLPTGTSESPSHFTRSAGHDASSLASFCCKNTVIFGKSSAENDPGRLVHSFVPLAITLPESALTNVPPERRA